MERRHDYDYPSDDSEGNQQNEDMNETEDDSYGSESEDEIQTYSWCRNARETDVGRLITQIKQLEKESKKLRQIRRRLTDETELELINEEIDYLEGEIKKLHEKLAEMEEEFLAQYE